MGIKVISDSSYGVKNSIVHKVLFDKEGMAWAIEAFNVYAKRHVCINLHEAIEYNSKQQIDEIVKKFARKLGS